jgi:cAMP-dependent protein kinase regulator
MVWEKKTKKTQGEAEATKGGGSPLMHYKRGDYFGELALLNNKPRAATIRAITNCKCASIDRQSFKVSH